MTTLQERLAGYLAVRRALGYRLARAEKLLAQFIAWMDGHGETTITTASAIAWATLPAGDANWHAHRLSVVRGFAAHVHALDPAHDLVPQDLLPHRPRRAVPYLYSDAEIRALMAASCVIATPHRAATMRALIGLLAVTGMRIGEAIRLDQRDIDHQHCLITVIESKFGKSRQLPVDASTTTAALRAYLRRADRPVAAEPTDALFTSAVGTRLTYCNVHLAFKRIVEHAGLVARSTVCRPRPHDLRHGFAVSTLLDAYRDDLGDGEHIQARLALLCTYLGHVNPGSTESAEEGAR